MHPRNLHNTPYDFDALARQNPELTKYLIKTPDGRTTLDYASPSGVRALNKALLLAFYGLSWWDIPPGALCPPVPGRSDYIHHLADLLAADSGEIPRGRRVRVIDIGTGANLVYPIIGAALYQWSFLASDINQGSLSWAKLLLEANKSLGHQVELRLQSDSRQIFMGLLKAGETFACSLCNPPFHGSATEACGRNETRLGKMGLNGRASMAGDSGDLNFGGRDAELWCPGGEAGFLKRMIDESSQFKDRVCWFSSLVSRRETLDSATRALAKAGVIEHRVLALAQGNKVGRILAWTFLGAEQRGTMLRSQQSPSSGA